MEENIKEKIEELQKGNCRLCGEKKEFEFIVFCNRCVALRKMVIRNIELVKRILEERKTEQDE